MFFIYIFEIQNIISILFNLGGISLITNTSYGKFQNPNQLVNQLSNQSINQSKHQLIKPTNQTMNHLYWWFEGEKHDWF